MCCAREAARGCAVSNDWRSWACNAAMESHRHAMCSQPPPVCPHDVSSPLRVPHGLQVATSLQRQEEIYGATPRASSSLRSANRRCTAQPQPDVSRRRHALSGCSTRLQLDPCKRPRRTRPAAAALTQESASQKPHSAPEHKPDETPKWAQAQQKTNAQAQLTACTDAARSARRRAARAPCGATRFWPFLVLVGRAQDQLVGSDRSPLKAADTRRDGASAHVVKLPVCIQRHRAA